MKLKTDVQGMFPDCRARVKNIELEGSEAHAKSSSNDTLFVFQKSSLSTECVRVAALLKPP
jgi:hypothetical protein